MKFRESVSVCFRKYIDFKGRASRSEFWWFNLFVIIVQLPVIYLEMSYDFNGADSRIDLLSIVSCVLYAVLMIPIISVSVRRMHDLNRSGWWSIIGYLAAVLNIFNSESWALVNFMLYFSLAIVCLVLAIVFLVWCSKRGTAGPNRFGPDPLAEAQPDWAADMPPSPIEDDLEVIDHNPVSWFFLKGKTRYYLEVNCSAGAAGYSATVVLTDDDLQGYRDRGAEAFDQVAREVDYYRAASPDSTSKYRDQTYPSSRSVWDAVDRWTAAGKPKGTL
jgi:uncharacterized membrane protein YhaH (DUF805 family)